MIFSAALLSSILGLVSAQCPQFGSLRNPEVPNPSVFLSPINNNAFYTDNIFQFALNSAPSASQPVLITTSVNNSRLTTRPRTLTFSASNFATPQTVEIIAPDTSNMTPIIGSSPLSLTFTSAAQPYQNTNCFPVSLTTSVNVPLTLNAVGRGGAPVSAAVATSNCSSAFGGITRTTLPSPYVWVRSTSNTTTYVDNTFQFAVNFAMTAPVTFNVSTGHPAIAANVSTFTLAPGRTTSDPIALTIARGTPIMSLAFPYNLTLAFSPVGQSFGLPPVTYNIMFNGERNDFGIGGYCFIECMLW